MGSWSVLCGLTLNSAVLWYIWCFSEPLQRRWRFWWSLRIWRRPSASARVTWRLVSSGGCLVCSRFSPSRVSRSHGRRFPARAARTAFPTASYPSLRSCHLWVVFTHAVLTWKLHKLHYITCSWPAFLTGAPLMENQLHIEVQECKIWYTIISCA